MAVNCLYEVYLFWELRKLVLHYVLRRIVAVIILADLLLIELLICCHYAVIVNGSVAETLDVIVEPILGFNMSGLTD